MHAGCGTVGCMPGRSSLNIDARAIHAQEQPTCSIYAHNEADTPLPASRWRNNTRFSSPDPPAWRTHQELQPLCGFTTDSIDSNELPWRRCTATEQQIELGLRSDLVCCSGQFDCCWAQQLHGNPFDGSVCQSETTWQDDDTEHHHPHGYVVHADIAEPGQTHSIRRLEQQGEKSQVTNASAARKANGTPFAATVIQPQEGFIKIEQGTEQQLRSESSLAAQPKEKIVATPNIGYLEATKKRQLARNLKDNELRVMKKHAVSGSTQDPATKKVGHTVHGIIDACDGSKSKEPCVVKQEAVDSHTAGNNNCAATIAGNAVQQNSLADKQHVQTLYLIANLLHQALQLVGYTKLDDWGIFAVMEPAGWRYKYCWKGRVFNRLQDAIQTAVTTERRRSSGDLFPPPTSLLAGNPVTTHQKDMKPAPLPAATILGQPILHELSHDGMPDA